MTIGLRIQQARRMRELSLRDLGDLARLSAQALSKYERGLDVPSSGSLLRLAGALSLPVEFFVRPRRILEIRPDYRKRSSLPSRQEEALLARILEWVDRYLEIEEIRTPEGADFTFPAGFPRPAGTLEDVEQAALDLREVWRLGWDPIENLTELLEDRNIWVGLVDAESRFDACTFRAEVDGRSRPVVVSRRGLPGDRQRFNLAHELGHLLLDPVGDLAAEAAANRFAGAYLVPAPAARFELGGRRRSLAPHRARRRLPRRAPLPFRETGHAGADRGSHLRNASGGAPRQTAPAVPVRGLQGARWPSGRSASRTRTSGLTSTPGGSSARSSSCLSSGRSPM